MMKFIDGPAAGQTLSIRRAPWLLRVTFNGKSWDCLNEPGDTPRRNETLFAYILKVKPTWIHLRMQPRSQSGFYAIGEYNLLEPQPETDIMWFNESWDAWLAANRARLMPDWYRAAVAEGKAQ